MLFLIVLIAASSAFWSLPPHKGGRSTRTAARRGMAAAFIMFGISHLALPSTFDAYFPDWVPFVTPIVYLTGALEIAGGIALLNPRHQRTVGIAIALYLLLVFPANIYAAIAGAENLPPGIPETDWYRWARLPLQAVFIWWALRSTQPSRTWANPSVPRQAFGPTRQSV